MIQLEEKDFIPSLDDAMTPRTKEHLKNDLELRREVIENDIENELHTCCGNGSTDRRLLIFIGKMTVSLCILIFSGIQLSLTSDDNNDSVYFSLISSVLSYWLGQSSQDFGSIHQK